MGKLQNDFEGSFTVVVNSIIRDQNLNNKDLGLLVRLISLPSGWNFSVAGLIAGHITPDKKKSISSSVRRIEELGYLRRIQSRNEEDGKFGSCDWILGNTPYSPLTLFRSTDNRSAGNPSTEKGSQLNKDILTKETSKKDNVLSAEDYAILYDKYGHTLVDDMISYIIKKNYKNCMNVPTISKWIDERLNRPQHNNNRFEYEHNYDFVALEKEILAN